MELPGYRAPATAPATYTAFRYDELPSITRDLDDEFRWLCAERVVPSSLAETTEPPVRVAEREQLTDLLRSHAIELPPSFLNFIASDEPRKRIRSATDCYLDLAEAVVPVDTGGFLIHFLSDSQFCFHWLLYKGPNGEEAVVATVDPYGFSNPVYWHDETSARSTFASGEAVDSFVCAASFSEFIYRLWIENEIWFRLKLECSTLTEEQQEYVGSYRWETDLDVHSLDAPTKSPACAVPQSLLTRVLRGLGL
jgi:hypothetical protein